MYIYIVVYLFMYVQSTYNINIFGKREIRKKK